MKKIGLQDNIPAQFYSGQGWGLLTFQRLNRLPERVTGPITAAALIIVLALVCVGVALIVRLVLIAWSGDADQSIRSSSAALTAIAGVFGAIFIFWRTLTAHWQARASQAQSIVARENQYTTLFSAAIDQLGATRDTKPNLEARLGAIYCFERIARESSGNTRLIKDVLCAYIRNSENTAYGFSGGSSETAGTSQVRETGTLRVDVQAALDVIGRNPDRERRLHIKDMLDLSDANLSGAIFYRSSLSDAMFDDTNLENSVFQQANLSRAAFVNVKLSNADFSGANLDDAVLSGADLRDVIGLTPDQLANTYGDATVLLPSSRPPPRLWVARELKAQELIELIEKNLSANG